LGVLCLKVRREEAEVAHELLKGMGLLNLAFEPARDGASVFFPLTRRPGPGELTAMKGSLSCFEIVEVELRPREARPSLQELLSRSLPPRLVEEAPRSFDVIGDIAIVEIQPELWPYRHEVGSAIMALQKHVRLVLAKGGPVSGPFRLRRLVPIAGYGPTETTHREHGCIFKLDVARAYFSPRLSYEHARVAGQARPGELVVDMFAGVGPFSIIMAKREPSVLAYAIDANPIAFHYLAMNVRANKLRGSVVPVLSDARRAIQKALRGLADRVIMDLPERAHEFLDAACLAIRPSGGHLHFYTFAGAPEPEKEAVERLKAGVEAAGRSVEAVLLARKVRPIGPYKWQVAVDAIIS